MSFSKEALCSGDGILIRRFGKFSVKLKIHLGKVAGSLVKAIFDIGVQVVSNLRSASTIGNEEEVVVARAPARVPGFFLARTSFHLLLDHTVAFLFKHTIATL